MIVLKNWALLRHVVASLKKESKVQVGPLAQATIVFDLDGTLVDTAPDLTNALNHVLTARGHAPVSAASVRFSVGFGARAMIEEGLRRAGVNDDVDQMLAAFLVH